MQTLVKIWEERLQKVFMVLARLTLGYVFFTQLFWKMPPAFGCPADFSFTTADASGRLQRTSGLCDWIGIESVWATRPHPVLAANIDNTGNPEIAVDIGFLARGNGAFIDNFVKPNIRWFGYAVWGMEAFIAVSMILGLFSRAGALVGFAQSMQLWIGLAGISSPFEWEWSYNWMPVLSLLLLAYAPGRIFGIDALIRPRLLAAAEKGNTLAGLLSLLT
jgi:uncharacterized membrane protein YphA (DoxX/SURF4 family)